MFFNWISSFRLSRSLSHVFSCIDLSGSLSCVLVVVKYTIRLSVTVSHKFMK